MHRVGDAIDAADFIPVVSRNRHLGDAIALLQKFQNDLCIEMPVAGESLQWNVAQRANGIGAIAGMKFGKLRADQAVFHEGEDFIADVLVHRQ